MEDSSMSTNIPLTTMHKIVKEALEMTKMLGKYLPHKLGVNQINYMFLSFKENFRIYSKTKSLM